MCKPVSTQGNGGRSEESLRAGFLLSLKGLWPDSILRFKNRPSRKWRNPPSQVAGANPVQIRKFELSGKLANDLNSRPGRLANPANNFAFREHRRCADRAGQPSKRSIHTRRTALPCNCEIMRAKSFVLCVALTRLVRSLRPWPAAVYNPSHISSNSMEKE